MLTAAEVKRLGREAGFAIVRIAPADSFPGFVDAVRERDEKGWLREETKSVYGPFKDPERYADAHRSLAEARSIISLAMPYRIDGVRDRTAPGRPCGTLPRNEWRDFYGEAARRRKRFEEMLRERGARCAEAPLITVKNAAHRAGTTGFVRSGLTHAEVYGPWVVLATTITDLVLEADEPVHMECGTCQRCVSACPTKAIVKPFVVNPMRCLVDVLASSDWIPREVRPLIGNRINSCDTCKEVCPRALNPLIVPDDFPDPRKRWTNSPDLIHLLNIGDEEFQEAFADLDWNLAEPRLLKRNTIVALGNVGDPVALPALEGMLGHEDAMLRAHAAWAVGRIGGRPAIDALKRALAQEEDERVEEEIQAALDLMCRTPY